MIEYLDIGADYSPYLGPRYKGLGKFSGEEFFLEFLEPRFIRSERLVILMDGIRGWSTSFLEEAFGRLAHKYGIEAVKERVAFDTIRNAHWLPIIETFMISADAARKAGIQRG